MKYQVFHNKIHINYFQKAHKMMLYIFLTLALNFNVIWKEFKLVSFVANQERNQDFAKGGAWKRKVLWRHFNDVYQWRIRYDVKNEVICGFLEFCCVIVNFYDNELAKSLNHTTSDRWDKKRSKISDSFLIVCSIFILLSRESDGDAIFWTNPHLLRSCPFPSFSTKQR